MPFHAFRSSRAAVCIAILCLSALLSGCDRAPTDADIKSDLTGYVESGYAPGLLDIVNVERLDHLRLPNFGRDRRTVSFAADLRLKRDYDFGVWDQPNAATLTYLLGARPMALSGLKAGGNKNGDLLHVTGALVYAREAEHWRLQSGVTADAGAQASPVRGRLAALRQWWRITVLTFRELISSPSSAITEDLAPALKSASARFTRQSGGMSLASGPMGGDYWATMQALSSVSSDNGLSMLNVATAGSRENLRLLRQNSVTAAVMRADEAALAAAGEGPFERDGTFPDLRALASLFPEQIHVLVMATSPVASVADLYGKRVAIVSGEPVALREAGDVLRAHRVPLSALAKPAAELPMDEALDALARGEQDAVILTAAVPSPALRNFVVASAIRFLPLDADAVALMTTGNSNYVAVTIPAQSYPGQGKPIATVGVTAMLVSTERVPAAETEGLLRQVFADVDFMRLGHPMGAMIKPSTARKGLTLPLHTGAEAFYGVPNPSK